MLSFVQQCPISSLCCVLCGSLLSCACLRVQSALCRELLSQHAAAALVSCQSVALLNSRFTLILTLLKEDRQEGGGVWCKSELCLEPGDWDSTALDQGKPRQLKWIWRSGLDFSLCNFGARDWEGLTVGNNSSNSPTAFLMQCAFLTLQCYFVCPICFLINCLIYSCLQMLKFSSELSLWCRARQGNCRLQNQAGGLTEKRFRQLVSPEKV